MTDLKYCLEFAHSSDNRQKSDMLKVEDWQMFSFGEKTAQTSWLEPATRVLLFQTSMLL